MNKNSNTKEILKNMVNTFVTKCKSYEHKQCEFSDSESSNMSSSDDESMNYSPSLSCSEDDDVLSETSDETDSVSSCDTAILGVISKLNILDLPKLPFLQDIEEYKLDFFEDAFVV